MPPPPRQFPTPPDKFVGRESELAELRRLFDGGARLVSILGPPGMGKTRLALRYAEERCRSEPGTSTWFVDLSSAQSGEELCASVGGLLGVASAGGNDIELRIAHALDARGPLTLVLDNFEQLVTPGASTLATWITRAPRARFLVTSREMLRIAGESWFELGPLSLPELDGMTQERLRGTSALELLLDRAPHLALTDENANAVGEILVALEGIPLAIELCAARMSSLGLAGVSSRMHGRLDLMNRGARNADPRQQTLRGAIDWSWHSLSGDERLALGVCAVFSQGFELDGYEALCAEVGAVPALDLLQALREKSLLRSSRSPASVGALRLGMYESIRAYVTEKLAETARLSELRLHHARYFATQGEHYVLQSQGAAATVALQWLNLETENLRAAHQVLSEQPNTLELRARLILALEPALSQRGPFDSYQRTLDELAAQLVNSPEPRSEPQLELAARIARARARVLRQRGLLAESALELGRARALCDATGAIGLTAELLTDCGELEQERGQFELAKAHYRAALSRIEARTEPHARARAHAGLGLLSHSQGKLDDAFAEYQRAMKHALSSGDLRLEAGLSKDIGSLRLQQGRLGEARELYAHALELLDRLEDAILSGVVEGNLAILAQEQAEYPQALEHFRNAERKLSRAGARLLEAHVRAYLGALHHELGEFDLAAATYTRALHVLREVGDVRLEGLFSAALGAVEAVRGNGRAAREAFEIAQTRLVEVGDPGLLEALQLHRGFLSLAASDEAAERGNQLLSRTERARAALLAQSARARADAGELADSDDARFALRLLERALGRTAWVFEIARSRVVPPDELAIDLGTRPQLMRIARVLAEHRVSAPGRALSQDALVAYAWPGEKMTTEAAANRMKVALSTLRKLGLRSLIQRTEHGYLLDPTSPVVLKSDSEPCER